MITSSTDYYIFKGWLESYDVNHSSSKVSAYAMDAGVVDSTGITTLLRNQVDSIVLFFNDNNDIREMNASFAYLFGIDTSKTNSMNALPGPKNSQVFDSNLYESFMSNLTHDPVRAHLRNVSVMRNEYFGIEAYELKDLYVLSNQYSDSFLNSFVDSQKVKSALNSKFPNSPWEWKHEGAQMLCLFNQWKIKEYGDEIMDCLSNFGLFEMIAVDWSVLLILRFARVVVFFIGLNEKNAHMLFLFSSFPPTTIPIINDPKNFQPFCKV